MKKHIIITLTAVVFISNIADAQQWRRFQKQVIGGVGVTNFLGDLRGGSSVGRDFIWDLDVPTTRPSLMVGYRYQFNNFVFGRANIQWGVLKGSDKYTTEEFRGNRNLKFRTGYFELDLMAEFYLIQNSKGNLYSLQGARGKNSFKLDVYIYGGLGFMFFNPKGEYQGTWHKLQPLGTEGQGLPGQPEKYKRTTFTIPYGIGIGKSIDRYWGINFEATFRHTFSDYIDDVSGEYFGRKNFRDAYQGQLSDAEIRKIAVFSDPSLGRGNNPANDFGDPFDADRNDLEGEIRGNPNNNDAFMTVMVNVSKQIVTRRRIRPKL
tara:strand:- start:3988 stop:4947 length:960 start_codon:yes stop_codon:yes gene_type:complete